MNNIELAREQIQAGRGKALIVPRKSYILCSSPRCGTYMLGGIMKDMQLGDPYEAFNFGANRRYRPYYDVDDFYILISRVLEKQTSPQTGVFGVKFFWEHLERFYQRGIGLTEFENFKFSVREMIEIFFHQSQYLLLLRRNIVKQAISLSRALQSNHFQTIDGNSDIRKEGKTFYDSGLISQMLTRILSEILLWEKFFTDYGITPFRLWYEDLVSDKAGSISSLIAFLGETADLIPEPHTNKIATQLNDEWYGRYMEENKWLPTSEITHLLKNKKHVEVLADLAFHQSLKVESKKNLLSARANRFLNAVRWRFGGGFGQ